MLLLLLFIYYYLFIIHHHYCYIITVWETMSGRPRGAQSYSDVEHVMNFNNL